MCGSKRQASTAGSVLLNIVQMIILAAGGSNKIHDDDKATRGYIFSPQHPIALLVSHYFHILFFIDLQVYGPTFIPWATLAREREREKFGHKAFKDGRCNDN